MGKYLKTADSDWFKQRLIVAMYCVIAVFVVLICRLFYLQVIEGEELRRLSENNCIRLQSIDPPRGLIYDRNGILLVDNRPSFDLSIILKDAKPINNTIEKLSKYIKTNLDDLMPKINKSKGISIYKPFLLKRDIGRDALAVINAHKYELPGVEVNVVPKRHYIERTAAHLIGYLSKMNSDELKSGKYPGCAIGDFIGKFGVEKACESYLRGEPGGRQVEVNATGQIVRILKTVDARPGRNIYLTIDLNLQQKAEKLLEGVAGAVAAMDPTTGEILALASSPSFDQNSFVNGMSHKQWNALISNRLRPMGNKAIQGEYPPASIYKIVTAIAGLEEGIINKDTTFYCQGHYKFGDRDFRCWAEKGHGRVDVVRALAESCDVFFYQVGQKVGIDRLAWYAKACGLGSATRINLDHEASGLVPTAAWKKRRTGVAWQQGETLSVAIGQGYNLVSPLQILVLTSAVANGGIRYKPLILKTIETAEGEIISDDGFHTKREITGKLPASRQTLEIVKKGLWQAVNTGKGTATIASIDGIDISGKTGTAQVVGRKQDETSDEQVVASHLKPHAWFVAFAPSEDPKIAVSVIVEHGRHGSSTAAPIARELIKTYLSSSRVVE
ncbi:MAG: penicillin-binding protein 2 [Candidatus Desulfaltia sp.]|nr:penicillin-binding protein 2 [Candidatus Desulfaltia sp.]